MADLVKFPQRTPPPQEPLCGVDGYITGIVEREQAIKARDLYDQVCDFALADATLVSEIGGHDRVLDYVEQRIHKMLEVGMIERIDYLLRPLGDSPFELGTYEKPPRIQSIFVPWGTEIGFKGYNVEFHGPLDDCGYNHQSFNTWDDAIEDAGSPKPKRKAKKKSKVKTNVVPLHRS